MKNKLSKQEYLKRSKSKILDIRGDYFRDQTAIIHSQPFRRLKHKTQVFFAPGNDHICTRIEHVMHVATIAKSVCLGLNKHGLDVNPEAVFAMGLGHDLGHAPFGHEGEMILDKIMKRVSGKRFIHEVNSYRVVEYLAENGKGMNLTYMVKDGIISHNGEQFEQYIEPETTVKDLDAVTNRKIRPSSIEGCIVRFSDKIAYLGRDIEDALTAGFIKTNDLPDEIKKYSPDINSAIINMMAHDLMDNSAKENKLGFSDETYEFLLLLRKHNYKYIYTNPVLKAYRKQAEIILNTIFDYLGELLEKYENEYPLYQQSDLAVDKKFGKYLQDMHDFYKSEKDPAIIITDYISGMTDNYVLDVIKQLTVPNSII